LSTYSNTPLLSNRMIKMFVAAAHEEAGADKLPQVLEKANLSPAVMEPASIARLSGSGAAEIYASLQRSLRLYYGRGARGLLLRIGRNMWARLVSDANFREKAELEIIRRLPVPARRKRVFDFVAEQYRTGGGSTVVHLLDTELLFVDRSGAATCGQESTEPICFVTHGILVAALYWATNQDADIEEISCKAMGAEACEFKFKPGESR
jgi:predicted hydrocarbon binding protein